MYTNVHDITKVNLLLVYPEQCYIHSGLYAQFWTVQYQTEAMIV